MKSIFSLLKGKSFIKQLGIIFFVFVIMITAFLFVAKDFMAKKSFILAAKSIVGVDVEISDMDWGIVQSKLHLKGLKIYNPEGYEEPTFSYLPEIYIDYDLLKIVQNKIHLKELKVSLNELAIVKSKNGRLNVDSILAGLSNEHTDPTLSEVENQKEIQIDLMKLNIGTVYFKDYSKRAIPVIEKYQLNIDEEFHDICSLQDIGGIIALTALKSTKNLFLADFRNLSKNLNLTYKNVEKTGLTNALGVLSSSKELGDKTIGTAKSVLDRSVNSIKTLLPFGKRDHDETSD